MDETQENPETAPEPPVEPLIPQKPARSASRFIWLSLPLVFLIGLGSGWLLWGRPVAATTPTNQVEVPAHVKRYVIPTDGDPAMGAADAPITLVEFSDYQCPYCIQWYNTVANRLLTDYSGKIRFVYKDLPLSAIHPNAQSAAEAADCAGEQLAYWKFHDALFSGKHGLGAQAYAEYASELGLDVNSFDTCVVEHRYKDKVDANASFVENMGFNSTPTFFLNGLAIVGAQPYEVFQQVIDLELAGKIPK